MKFFFAAFIILAVFSCKKTKQKDDKAKTPVTLPECGTLLTVPVLDSFVYPTCYITAIVAFPEGNETVHFHYNVTGNHDGSWFLDKYNKDSTYCTTP